MAIKIYKLIQNVILSVASLILIFLLVSCIFFKVYPGIIVSGSMEPEIKTGSVCFIDHKKTYPNTQDIITYKAGDIKITHRVISITNDGYITKGDNNDVADPKAIKQEQIIGTYLFSIPFAGYIIVMMRTKMGIALILSALAIFILIGILLRTRKEY